MGLMTCSRKGCDNILCDTYIPSVGYICRECQREFKNYLASQNVGVYSDHDIEVQLERFLDTCKDDFIKSEGIDIDDFFHKHTN